MLSCNQKALALRHTLTTFIAQCEGSKETPETLLSACIKTDTTSRSLQQEDNPKWRRDDQRDSTKLKAHGSASRA